MRTDQRIPGAEDGFIEAAAGCEDTDRCCPGGKSEETV